MIKARFGSRCAIVLATSGLTRRAIFPALSLTVASIALAATVHADTTPYTVQPGDTCDGIAAKVLGDKSKYTLIHEANPELGPAPHHLVPGSILRIPTPGVDAKVTHVHQDVEAETPAPHKARQDEPLQRGHRVSTQADSTAEVTFTDTTRLQLGEHTLIVILGASSSKVSGRKFATDTTLVTGSLRVHFGALSGEAPRAAGTKAPAPATTPHEMPIATSAGRVTLGAGEAQVTVDDKATTRLAVYRGESKLVAQGAAVTVASGFGSKAVEGKKPTPPKPLPAAPTWTENLPSLVLARQTGGTGASVDGVDVAGTFAPSPGVAAAKWHLQLARDEAFNDLIVNVEVPVDVLKLEAHKLTPGGYFARVSAIDGDKFEGAYSTIASVTVVPLRLADAVGVAPATIAVPAGLWCGLDGAPLALAVAPLHMPPRKSHTLRCALAADSKSTAEYSVPFVAEELRLTPLLGPIVATADGAERLVTLRVAHADGAPLQAASVKIETDVEGIAVGPVTALEGGSYASTTKWKRGSKPATLHFVVDDAQSTVVALDNITPDSLPPSPRVDAPIGPWRVGVGVDGVAGSKSYDLGLGAHVEGGARFDLGGAGLAIGGRVGLLRYSGGTFEDSAGSSLASTVLELSLPIGLVLGRPNARLAPYLSVMPTLLSSHSTETYGAALASPDGAPSLGRTRDVSAAYFALDARLGVELHMDRSWIFGEVGYRWAKSSAVGDFESGLAALYGVSFSGGLRF